MGERHLGAAKQWLVPLALLIFLVSLSLGRPLLAPDSPRATSHYLGAASLGGDFDLRFEEADLERLRELVRTDSPGLLLAGEAGAPSASYPDNVLGMLYIAPFARMGGLRMALAAQALVLVVAMGFAAVTLRQRFDEVWRILLTCLFGSIVLGFLDQLRPEILTLAAVISAFALAYRGEAPRFEELAEVFDDRSARVAGFTLRWLAVGALLGFVVLSHPVYLLLLVAAVTAIPPASRRLGTAILALGCLVAVGAALGLAFFLGGPLPWVSELALFGSSGSNGVPVPSLLASARPLIDSGLLGWNVLFVAAGRNVGVLPYYLPLLLVLALWEPRRRRSTLVMMAALAALVTVLVWPFDWAGDAVGLGNAVLLPIYGALWLVPTRRPPAWALLAALLVAGAFLWPTWLSSLGLWAGGHDSGALVSPVASRWLPHESTRRPLGDDYFLQGALRALPAGGAVSERRGRLFLRGGRWGNLVAASPRPLTHLYLAFDGQAGAELEVAGGTLGDTVFRGDGGIGFEIELVDEARRHRMWWSSEPQSLYDLRLRLPKAPRVPVAFSLQADTEP